MENADNVAKNNNIKIRGLKEGIKGEGLIPYLKEIFSVCLGADSTVKLRIIAAYIIGPL